MAKSLAEKGRKAYREVRLKDAAQQLTNALERLLSLDYQVVDSEYVGRLALLVGLAHLENQRLRESQEMFERALLIHPRLRLKQDYDHPKAIVAFERVRLALNGRPHLVPPRFGTVQRIPKSATLVKARLTNSFMELLVISERGIQTYRQALTTDPAGRCQPISKSIICVSTAWIQSETIGRRRTVLGYRLQQLLFC